MGCDIHLHIEVKLDGAWHHYAAPNVSRWYGLFEKLAGVRGDIKNAISEPKGLPDDVTLVTLRDADHWKLAAHNHSWVGVDEIVKLEQWLREQPADRSALEYDLEHSILHTYLGGSSFTAWKIYGDNYLGVEDVRFVFWFDS